jgi:hypothetical protein
MKAIWGAFHFNSDVTDNHRFSIVIWDAALALIARDYIGQEFTQEQYDLLTRAWRATIGPLHSDDAAI